MAKDAGRNFGPNPIARKLRTIPHRRRFSQVGEDFCCRGNVVGGLMVFRGPPAFSGFNPHLVKDAGVHAHDDTCRYKVRHRDCGEECQYEGEDGGTENFGQLRRRGVIARFHIPGQHVALPEHRHMTPTVEVIFPCYGEVAFTGLGLAVSGG